MLHTEVLLLYPEPNKIFNHKQNPSFCYVNRLCVSLFADLSSLCFIFLILIKLQDYPVKLTKRFEYAYRTAIIQYKRSGIV